MVRAKLTIALTLMLTLLGTTVATAQEEGDAEDESTPYWYVSQYKVPFSKIDSLYTLMQEYGNEVADRAVANGDLLDYKLLIHHTATEYTVTVMRLHESWNDINEGTGFGDAAEEVIPDEELRNKVESGFDWVYEGAPHKDDIYVDVTE